MVGPPFEDTSKLTKGPWTKEEDKKLNDYILKHGHKNWKTLPKRAGLNRCGKSCRLRWMNYLRPGIKRGDFSDEEERLIIKLHSQIPNKWSRIASQLPGRTDNEIKNYWNTHLRKKLLQKFVNPITHQPLLNSNPLSNLSLLNLMAYHNFNNAFYPNNNLQLPQILMQILNQNAFDPTNVLLRYTFDPIQLSQNLMQIGNPNLFGNLPFDYDNLGTNPQVYNTITSASNSMASFECEFQPKLDNLCYNYINNDCILQRETSLPNLVETPNIVNQFENSLSPTHSPNSIMFENWDKFCNSEADVIQWLENMQ